MGKLSVDSVSPGMTLAADACNFRGQPLLKAGVELTEKHVKTLHMWGVSEVEVEGHDEPTLDDVEARMREDASLAAASEELDEQFQDVRDDPLMSEILRIAKKQLAERRA